MSTHLPELYTAVGGSLRDPLLSEPESTSKPARDILGPKPQTPQKQNQPYNIYAEECAVAARAARPGGTSPHQRSEGVQ